MGATRGAQGVADVNSVLALVNAAGQIVEQYRYDAWGRTTVFDASGNPLSASAVGNRYCWQGREYSFKSGLYYFRARWTDPVTVRWLSPDPIGIAGGLNQYVFCRNNPVNFVDPFGLRTAYVIVGAGAYGASSSANSVANTLASQGWTVVNTTAAEFRNLPATAEVNGLVTSGHGDAGLSAGVSLGDVANVLSRTGGQLDVAVSLSCHSYDYVSALNGRNLLSPSALMLGYVGYSKNSFIRDLRIRDATKKWSECEEFTDVKYGNAIMDGLGIVVYDGIVSPSIEGVYRLCYWIQRKF